MSIGASRRLPSHAGELACPTLIQINGSPEPTDSIFIVKSLALGDGGDDTARLPLGSSAHFDLPYANGRGAPKNYKQPSFGSAKLLKLDELETGARVNHPVYNREAAVAQYKECFEHAKAKFQDEMQQRNFRVCELEGKSLGWPPRQYNLFARVVVFVSCRSRTDGVKSVGGRQCSRLQIGSKNSACPSMQNALPKTALIFRFFPN